MSWFSNRTIREGMASVENEQEVCLLFPPLCTFYLSARVSEKKIPLLGSSCIKAPQPPCAHALCIYSIFHNRKIALLHR
jgi:hypothetical protein